jgi:DNA-binding transcriptional ArsR family regulator
MERSRSRAELLRALDSPIRLRILIVARGRSLEQCSPSAVKAMLTKEFNVNLETRKVHYHLTRLQDVGLLPRPLLPGV